MTNLKENKMILSDIFLKTLSCTGMLLWAFFSVQWTTTPTPADSKFVGRLIVEILGLLSLVAWIAVFIWLTN